MAPASSSSTIHPSCEARIKPLERRMNGVEEVLLGTRDIEDVADNPHKEPVPGLVRNVTHLVRIVQRVERLAWAMVVTGATAIVTQLVEHWAK